MWQGSREAHDAPMFSTHDTTKVLVQDHQRILRRDARTSRLLRAIRRSHHEEPRPARVA
jgi:hypothetical protein